VRRPDTATKSGKENHAGRTKSNTSARTLTLCMPSWHGSTHMPSIHHKCSERCVAPFIRFEGIWRRRGYEPISAGAWNRTLLQAWLECRALYHWAVGANAQHYEGRSTASCIRNTGSATGRTSGSSVDVRGRWRPPAPVPAPRAAPPPRSHRRRSAGSAGRDRYARRPRRCARQPPSGRYGKATPPVRWSVMDRAEPRT
jgi:hypothetical protein